MNDHEKVLKEHGLIPMEKMEINSKDHPLIFRALKIREKKGEDYDAGKVEFGDYFPFGHKSYVQMLYLKALRLVSLVEKDGPPNFDGIDDTLIDFVVYANQYMVAMEEGTVE